MNLFVLFYNKNRMGIISSGEIILYPVNDAYSVLLSPSSVIIKADYNGNNASLGSAYTDISVICGNEKKPFTISNVTASGVGIGHSVRYNGTVVDNRLSITSVPNSLDSGTLSFMVTAGDVFTTVVTFNYSLVKESTMLDWIQNWNTNRTTINGESIITPKIFAGTKGNSGKLTGVLIGNFNSSPGIYGYVSDNEVFHINSNGAKLGGWDITSGAIKSGNISIDSAGSISSVSKGNQAVTHWTLNNDGSASFANGKVTFGSNGNAEFNGTITSSAGSIGEWTIESGRIRNGAIGIESRNKVIAVANVQSAPSVSVSYIDLVKANGGVAMHYTSPQNYGMIGYSKIGQYSKQTFSLGSSNFIGGWNFDDEAIFTGTKNNTVDNYTDDYSSITIGTQGMRGNSWYINTNGVASFAGGNVNFRNDGSAEFNGAIASSEGVIGGWEITKDAIFTGTQNDTSGAFASMGSITIGSNGLRGDRWRIEKDGSGAFSNGKISWGADGNVSIQGDIKLTSGHDIVNKNLILNSSGVIQFSTVDRDWSKLFALSEQPKTNTMYTVSWDDMSVPNNTSGNGVDVYLWSGSWDTAQVAAYHFKGGKGEFTFTTGANLSGKYDLAIYRYAEIGGSVTNIKLEEGGIKTNYLPASEDAKVGENNLILNGDFCDYEERGYGWNVSLNGTRSAKGWDDFNGGVPLPNLGYHAHIEDQSGCLVYALNNLNKQFSTSIDLSHRYLGINQLIPNFAKNIQAGDEYTISFDACADTVGYIFHGGMYLFTNSWGFHDDIFRHEFTTADINKWIRVTKTFKSVGTTQTPRLYIYGDSGAQGTGWLKNVSLQKGNIGYWTGAATKENILSMINLSNEDVTIKGGKISLEGTVTANNNFIVNPNGTVKMVNADVSGSITATSGRIGSLTVVGTDDPATNQDDRQITFTGNGFSGTLASMCKQYIKVAFPPPNNASYGGDRQVGMYIKTDYLKEGDFVDTENIWLNKTALLEGNTEMFGVFINNTSEVKVGLKADAKRFWVSFIQNNDQQYLFPKGVFVNAAVHNNMIIKCGSFSGCSLTLPRYLDVDGYYSRYMLNGGDLLIELSIIPHTDNTVPFIITENATGAYYRLYKNGVKVSYVDVPPGKVAKIYLSAIHDIEANKNSVVELRAICTI